MKTCTKCNESKSLDSFYKNKGYKCGLTARCKICINTENDAWKSANLDKVALYKTKSAHKRYIADPEGSKESVNKFRRNNPEFHRESNRKWRKNNPDKINAKNANRRATKLQATPQWAIAEKDQILALYSQAKALTELTGVSYHVDHIVPLNSPLVQGLHCLANLQILEAKQNITKNNLTWPNMP